MMFTDIFTYLTFSAIIQHNSIALCLLLLFVVVCPLQTKDIQQQKVITL